MIIRACAYNAVIRTAINPTEYSKILVTFAQDQQILIEKTENELTIGDDGVVVSLTQEETLLFKPSAKSVMGRRIGSPAYLQIRAYKSAYDAPGSKQFEIDVLDSQSEEVLDNA